MGVIKHKKQNYSGVSPYKYVPITTANYNALPQSEKMDSTKVYFLIDAKVASARIDDTDTSTGKVWSSKKVSDEIDAIQDQVDDNTADITTLNSNFTITSGSTNITGITWIKMGKIAILSCKAVDATITTITGAPTPAVNNTFLCPLQSANNIVGYILIQNKSVTIRSTAGNGYGTLVYFCE